MVTNGSITYLMDFERNGIVGRIKTCPNKAMYNLVMFSEGALFVGHLVLIVHCFALVGYFT